MLIVPTKKAIPLFSTFPITARETISLESSFFSWHANYFNSNRKKILVIVNDLTLSPTSIYRIRHFPFKH